MRVLGALSVFWGCVLGVPEFQPGGFSFVRKIRVGHCSSGKEKAHKHKHKQFFSGDCPGGGGVSRPGGQGSPDRVARGQKFMCCVRNPRNINILVRVPGREDRVPGREDR